MRILTMTDKKKMEIAEKPIPQPGDKEALIKVSYAGICGGDWHMVWTNGVRAGKNAVAGHEFCGVVVNSGDGTFQTGDRVTAIEYTPCGECEYCKSDRPHLCLSRFSNGIGLMHDGAFAEYLTARTDMIYKIPDNVSDVQAAMIEPCAVGMHGVRIAGVKEGSKVLITGAGAIGLFAAACAKALGASTVAITEVDPIRLSQAEAADFIDFVFNGADENLADSLRKAADGLFDCAVECSGNSHAATTAIEAVKPGGTMTVLAYGAGPKVDYFPFINDEKRIQGAVFFKPEDFRMVIDFMEEGKINIEKYAEIIRMEEVQNTFLGLDNGSCHAAKYVIQMNK